MMMGFTEQETAKIVAVKNRLKTIFETESNITTWGHHVLSSLIEPHLFVTGGAFASLMNDDPLKDIDVYCKDQATMDVISKWLLAHEKDIQEVDEKYREVECWKVPGKMVTEKSITMNNKFSFITMNHGYPADIKASFDFLHCTPHFEPSENKLYMSRAQYDSIATKTLVVNNPDAVTTWRTEKFSQRGWKVDREIWNLAAKNSKGKKKTFASVSS
jgi:hypothetical protein